jgi:hypothetical protein
LKKSLVIFIVLALQFSKLAYGDGPKFCAGIRGNGELITSHWASLATLMERENKLVDGGMGGSSGSITLFLYESILNNPQLRKCDGGSRACTNEEVIARTVLLVKSLFGYIQVIQKSPEAIFIEGITKEFKVAVAADKTQGAVSPQDAQVAFEAYKKMRAVLKYDSGLQKLLNPEILTMIASKDDLSLQQYRIGEVKNEIQTFGNFSPTDVRNLLRPGLINFKELAVLFGRIGNFYAGRGIFGTNSNIYNASDMQSYLDLCATVTRGKSWGELSSAQSMCASKMISMMTTYRESYLTSEGPSQLEPRDTRLNDPVGGAQYGHFVVIMGVLDQNEWLRVKERQDCYQKNDVACYTRPLKIYNQTHFGYFGASSDLEGIKNNRGHYDDLKTAKAKIYPGYSWRVALERSPAEPGLARVTEGLSSTEATLAGWVDLHPIQQLKNMGCAETTFITRRTAVEGSDDSKFAQGIGTMLGMTPIQHDMFYKIENLKSSFTQALALADHVLCTDWDAFKGTDISNIESNAFTSPLYSKEFLASGGAHYRGCGPAANSFSIEKGVADKENLLR